METPSIPLTDLSNEVRLLTIEVEELLGRADALIRFLCKKWGTAEAFTCAAQIEDAHRYAASARMWTLRIDTQLLDQAEGLTPEREDDGDTTT